jgi:hypothetical protein
VNESDLTALLRRLDEELAEFQFVLYDEPNDSVVHERLGPRVSTPLPRSPRITGSVEEWESWTGMAFPDSGDYVFPEGLAPLHVDRESGRGRTGNRTSG